MSKTPPTTKLHRELGKAVNVRLGKEGHGIWTFDVEFKREIGNQSFGGYALTEYAKAQDKHIGSAAGMDMVIGICEALGADSLDKVVGKTCWLLFDDTHWNSMIKGIQQLETDGKGLFTVDAWRKRWFQEECK